MAQPDLPVLLAFDRSETPGRLPPSAQACFGRARRSPLTPRPAYAAIFESDITELDPPVPMAGATFMAYVKVTNKGELSSGPFVLLGDIF
jgi:hypothetical protein